jgi:hypothetical protein
VGRKISVIIAGGALIASAAGTGGENLRAEVAPEKAARGVDFSGEPRFQGDARFLPA